MSDVDQAPVDVSFDQAAAEVGATGEDVFFHEYGEGESALRFKTAEELNNHLSKSINFESDYTKKSQAREAEYRKNMEAVQKEREAFTKERERWEKEEKAKYDRYNEALQRRPAIAAQLQRMVNTPVSPDEAFQRSQGYVDQKYQTLEQKVDEINKRYEQEQMERETNAIYDELERKYSGLSRDVVKNTLNNLDGNDPRALLDLIARAAQYDPAGMQERVEQNIAKKAGAGMLPSGGGSPPVRRSGSTDPKVVNEEAQAWANS